MSEAMRIGEQGPTATLFRLVDFVCPRCGEERRGSHVDADDGSTFVECHSCESMFDAAVLRVPTMRHLEAWRADAALHGDTALRSADGIHGCSYLALASCRRLRSELTPFGKMRLLSEIVGSAGGRLHDAQRVIVAELGAALGVQPAAVSALLALR
jgi:hypothetical protein